MTRISTAGIILPNLGPSGPAGVRDTAGRPATRPHYPDDPGYCYLSFFRPEHHLALGDALGCNPWVPAVQAGILSNTGILDAGRFLIRTSSPISTGGDRYVQWHVEPSQYGVTAREFAVLGLGNARVGADVHQSALPAELPRIQGSSLAVHAGPAPAELHLPFAFILPDKQAACISWETITSWRNILSPYESVELTGFTFSAALTGDVSSVLRFRVTTSGTYATAARDWVACFYSKRFSGAAGVPSEGSWSLPPNHPYGRELKATALGTDPPRFQFHFTGNGEHAEITGVFSVRPRGAAPPMVCSPTFTAVTLA